MWQNIWPHSLFSNLHTLLLLDIVVSVPFLSMSLCSITKVFLMLPTMAFPWYFKVHFHHTYMGMARVFVCVCIFVCVYISTANKERICERWERLSLFHLLCLPVERRRSWQLVLQIISTTATWISIRSMVPSHMIEPSVKVGAHVFVVFDPLVGWMDCISWANLSFYFSFSGLDHPGIAVFRDKWIILC